MSENRKYEVTATINGKRRHFYGATRREAIQKRDEYKRKAQAFPTLDEHITLAEWCDAWLETIQNEVKPNTLASYRQSLTAHIITQPIGCTELSELKPTMFRLYWNQMQKSGLSPRTVIYTHTLVKAALQLAVEDEIIPSNPLLAVRRPKMERREAEYFTEADLVKLFDAIHEEQLSRIAEFTLATGMRRSEVLGLRWKDVDFEHCLVSINQTVLILNKKASIVQATKTKSSRRTLAIDAATAAILKEQRTFVQKRMLTIPPDQRQHMDLVFCGDNGRPMHPDTVSNTFKDAVLRAGLSGLSFKSLRHTHATLLIKHNVHAKIVQARLGHSTFNVTMDTYSHVMPEMDHTAANVIAETVRKLVK